MSIDALNHGSLVRRDPGRSCGRTASFLCHFRTTGAWGLLTGNSFKHADLLVEEDPMESSKNQPDQHAPQPVKVPTQKPKRFQIVKLEPRIAPRLAANHNEILIRDVS